MKNYILINQEGIAYATWGSAENLRILPPNVVEVPDHNPSLIGRKWDGQQWSQEKYDIGVPVEVQEKINILEQENQDIKSQNIMTQGMLMEMMGMLAILSNQGGGQ